MTIAQFFREPHNTPILIELRTSVEVATVTWALIQADYALQGRPLPEKITDLHHGERRKYEEAALIAVLSMNRDADLYASSTAADTGFEELVQFCKDHDLDWLDDSNPVNDGDELELLIHRCVTKGIQRYRHLLSGVYPGVSRHLAKLENERKGVR